MTYALLRLAAGDVTAYDLLNTASYALANWTVQSDQLNTGIEWGASLPETGLTREFASGIELGSGRFISPYSGRFEFFLLTQNMQQYLNTTIMNNKPVALVTAYAYDDYTRDRIVVTGELVSPHVANQLAEYSPFGATVHSNVQYAFRGGTAKTVSHLLLENGDRLLAENGDLIALETQS